MSSSRPSPDVASLLGWVSRSTRSGVRSTQQVAASLRRRGVAPEVVAQVVGACRRRGLLDDRACARLWADAWARKGYAWAAIRAKLAEKGLDEEAITQAGGRVGLAATSADEARARELLQRRIGRRPGPTRAQAARLLAARGFDADLSERLLNDSFERLSS